MIIINKCINLIIVLIIIKENIIKPYKGGLKVDI